MSRLATLLVFATTLGALAFTAAPALAAGDANESRCGAVTEASPGFRSYLPDCRAYEQVTPIFKDATQQNMLALSEDGSKVIARSLGGFAGTEYDSEIEGATYLLSRSPAGWGVSALSPPSSSFPTQEWRSASVGLSSTLWTAHTPSESIEAVNLYRRESNGAMVKIGPVFPPSATAGSPSGEFQGSPDARQFTYQAASNDLSHVVFSMLEGARYGLLWPGDTTKGQSSLYEYVGAGQAHPELVGVDNEQHLISPCATWLGSYASTDVYNALSADGSTVFFTAEKRGACNASQGPEVRELYARLGGLATVPISEPAALQCSACKTPATAAEGRASAEFAGASQDGSKVFFTTEQELLPGSPGGLALYEYDFDAPAGAHLTRIGASGAGPTEVQGVARVSEDGSRVYFVARGRLSEGARAGKSGQCVSELTPAEQASEATAEEQETKAQPVTAGAKCRPRPEADNLYVFEDDAAHSAGHIAFIATLCTGELQSGGDPSVSQCPSFRSDESDWELRDIHDVQATPDGRVLVFTSAGDLTEGASDTSGFRQIFEYDAATEELVRISKEQPGYDPEPKLDANENPSEISAPAYSGFALPTAPATNLDVSADGSIVVFVSAAALTGDAETAGAAKVDSAYEYRSAVASGGSIATGDLYLLSGEGTAPNSGLKGTDASGQDVFFTTGASLLPQDTDTAFDTYDARSDGGFLAPDPPAGCVAEACETALYAPPVVAAPGTTSLSPAASTPFPAEGVPLTAVKPKPRTAAQIRAARLASALKLCRSRRSPRERALCKSLARKRFGAPPAHKSTGRTK